MPIRHAMLNHQLRKNRARLHLAMLARSHSHGADEPASEDELALVEERRQLKAARAERQAQTMLPRVKAPNLVATHHAAKQAKAVRPAKDNEAKVAKSTKPKAHVTRTEKHAQKAAALDAARRASKKSAKT